MTFTKTSAHGRHFRCPMQFDLAIVVKTGNGETGILLCEKVLVCLGKRIRGINNKCESPYIVLFVFLNLHKCTCKFHNSYTHLCRTVLYVLIVLRRSKKLPE